MTPAISTFAAFRYGYGFTSGQTPPNGAADLLARLEQPDLMPQVLPLRSFATEVQDRRAYRKIRRANKKNKQGAGADFKLAKRTYRRHLQFAFLTNIARPVVSDDSFRERLVWFWADHFAIVAKSKGLRQLTTPYVEEAIRPLITGNFRDLLRSAVTHPVMLTFLDQISSIGPNSPKGQQKGKGLNENLAREILELHTLGVGGAYGQADVRQFAELLTGLQNSRRGKMIFRANMAEPGAETVLGTVYGSDNDASINDIYQALDDIALHPDTARHLARKLVVHFVSDQPDGALVDHVARAYSASGGDLMATYTALLEHPKAWQDFGGKARQPFDFIVSALRALDVSGDVVMNLSRKDSRLYISAPLQIMGQPFQAPGGPDGWPEPIEDWITPQGMAARIQWALLATRKFGRVQDPQDFANAVLADAGSKSLTQAVGAAESRLEGMALVLASPQFNRR